MSKIFKIIGCLFVLQISPIVSAELPQLPLCPNGAKLTGGYAPAPWPTCPALFGSVYVNCLNQGKTEEECRGEMQIAADAKDNHSQCLWQVICENKAPGSVKVVTRDERNKAEGLCL